MSYTSTKAVLLQVAVYVAILSSLHGNYICNYCRSHMCSFKQNIYMYALLVATV